MTRFGAAAGPGSAAVAQQRCSGLAGLEAAKACSAQRYHRASPRVAEQGPPALLLPTLGLICAVSCQTGGPHTYSIEAVHYSSQSVLSSSNSCCGEISCLHCFPGDQQRVRPFDICVISAGLCWRLLFLWACSFTPSASPAGIAVRCTGVHGAQREHAQRWQRAQRGCAGPAPPLSRGAVWRRARPRD